MSFTFALNDMIDDISVISKAYAKYLVGGSQRRLLDLGTDLTNAVLDSGIRGGTDFTWKTRKDSPIEITPSKNWKGSNRNFDPIHAIITVDYICRFDCETRRVVVKEGVCVARLRPNDFGDNADSGEKVFHFDVGTGGWTSINGAVQAGHPPFHMQFYGSVNNDLPRLPSLIFYPTDVVSLVMLELHQSDWRIHLGSSEVRSKLRHYPRRQHERVNKVLDKWKSSLRISDNSFLISLQNRMIAPLDL